ncbi:flagellar basal-body MS-ring/collar protein FliF [Marinobacterium sedimentorum]|uniref:flagellar basal-body MS-ring/collar protein FliF n=1 Tax=Marinobacterium sedimentorum TaxID=2927804 RepID=UPI0020C66156|nr:flagellar basal-body MS-ring/collar protein FliF [Marinobacterium sedimentorum]MCP8689421.1 flagellar M-ring protein FliF [Marinobacterium sedimentorum]
MDNTPAQLEGGKRGLMAGFSSLSILRQIGLMVGLAASVAIGFAVVLWSQQPDYRVLFSNLSFADANQVIEQLRLYNTPYKFDADGRAILVPQEHVHQARLKLAAEGFTADKSVGFELLDQEQTLGTSQFMENARYRRGLEGELSRTIASLVAIRSARVHLAIPKSTVFIRDERKPSASVFVELFAGRRIEPNQVAAIASLVASSVPELEVRDVTVVDQKGRLLNTRDVDEDVVLAGKQLDYTHKIEETLLNRVNSILQPVVGLGNYRAEVSADIDFNAVEQTSELFNPDLPSLRSEQTVEESRAGGQAAGGVPGALSNQPPGPSTVPEVANGAAAAGAGGALSGSSRQQAVRNYELDRSISYTRQQMGRVRRLTVAVVVDDIPSARAQEGGGQRQPWSQNELERLRILVQDAVGYSPQRGDSVNVINSAFAAPESFVEAADTPLWQQDWLWDIVKQVMAALFVLLLVFGVLRPILKNLAVPATDDGKPLLGSSGNVAAELEGLESSDVADDRVTFGNKEESFLSTPNESFEYQINTIRSMVAEDPARVAQAVRQWVAEHE